MKREYFYKDAKGTVHPYHYCSECGKQYKDDEFKAGSIVNVGSDTTPIKYCAKTCLLIKFPPVPVVKKKQEEEIIDSKELE